MSTLRYEPSSGAGSVPPALTERAEQALQSVVRDLIITADEVNMSRPSEAVLRELLRQVMEISRQMFPGDVRVKVGRDWEVPDDIYFVVDVRSSGTPDEFVARLREWDSAAYRIAGSEMRFFCLTFHMD